MSQPDPTKAYHDRIRAILVKEWDPIGVASVPQGQDEYDSYVGEIYRMLINREPRHTLVEHLWQLETESMALSGDRRHTEAVADSLLRLRDDMEHERSRY